MDHIQESLSLGRLCCLFFLCLYCMISCCHLSHCGHPLHLFVRTIYLYLPLKVISFSIVHHNKGQGVEKADVLFQTIAFWKVTRSKIYFDGSANMKSLLPKTEDPQWCRLCSILIWPNNQQPLSGKIDTFNASLTQRDFPFKINTLKKVQNSRSQILLVIGVN